MEESKGSEPMNDTSTMSENVSANPNPAGSKEAGDVPEYSLCAVLLGHSRDVRSLAVGSTHLYSGGRDKKVMAWKLDESGRIQPGTHKTPEAELELPDWVNALTYQEGGQTEGELVVAGCSDGVLYVMELEENLMGKDGGDGSGCPRSTEQRAALVVRMNLSGHEAPICSLSWTAEGLLLSGSWDESARAWDLKTSACKWVLGRHENNVCVLGLSPGSIATGSTGLEVDGRLVGQQIRMWQGFPPKECRSLTDHASGIRDLCKTEAPRSTVVSGSSNADGSAAFCSASNDGTVRAWTGSGDYCGVFLIPDESLIFSVRCAGNGVIVSGDDAGNLSAFRLSSESSSTPQHATVVYKHPKTVWCVASLPPGTVKSIPGVETPYQVGDVVTGSADHAVRVFTADAGRALKGDGLKEAEEAAGWRKQRECSEGASSELPAVSEMEVMVGEEDGQLSAFADDVTGGARVFRWVEASNLGTGKWESVGTLRPPRRKVSFEGGLYDKVIPVEIDSASRGMLFFQLGVNRGDDPKDVAAAFCQKHSLGPEYLPQIEQFLLLAALL